MQKKRISVNLIR